MARPRKDEHEKRQAHLPPVRLTQAELITIGDQAREAGLSLSDFARRRLLGESVPSRPSAADARLLSELNRCGVNLNQIAHRLNRGQDLRNDFSAVLAELSRVLALVGRSYGS